MKKPLVKLITMLMTAALMACGDDKGSGFTGVPGHPGDFVGFPGSSGLHEKGYYGSFEIEEGKSFKALLAQNGVCSNFLIKTCGSSFWDRTVRVEMRLRNIDFSHAGHHGIPGQVIISARTNSAGPFVINTNGFTHVQLPLSVNLRPSDQDSRLSSNVIVLPTIDGFGTRLRVRMGIENNTHVPFEIVNTNTGNKMLGGHIERIF